VRDAKPSRWLVIAIVFAVGFLCGAASADGAVPCVRIQVRPQTMLRRNDLDVQARVCRDDRNRQLRIEWDADPRGWVGSSETQLSGATAPIAYQFWLEDYPAANYDFLATSRDGNGRILSAGRARVVAPGEEP
jgi:hypothetical protein